ncbi:MAG: HEPN domain-containing protein [Candidatus Pacebacteria bacterium]|nr:HEPN domain-containing protein [Candidatus Paceibacterota bacterium]
MKKDFLLKKAEAFLEDAQYDIKTKKWFLAAFHLEQTCQLYLKYYLFLKLRRFPKTYSLKDLLEGIGKAYKKEKEVQKFIKENADVIGNLEQAYITARYLPVEFFEEQIKNMEEFTQNLISFLKNL